MLPKLDLLNKTLIAENSNQITPKSMPDFIKNHIFKTNSTLLITKKEPNL